MSESKATVGIIGATGLVGSALSSELENSAWPVVRFSRRPPAGESGWRTAGPEPDLSGLQAVINLAGESVATRWTKSRWAKIVESRVGVTKSIVEALARLPADERPAVLLNASAVGVYPSAGDRELREDEPAGESRLAKLCLDWEAEAKKAEALGVRVVLLRLGIVLGQGGAAWERLHRVFRFGLGGRLGSGRQWMPWIHLADVAGGIRTALESESVSGPVNLCAPEPVTNRELTRTLAAALRRPAFFHAPGVLLRLGLGGFADSLLASNRVVPARLQQAGYTFRFPKLSGALDELLG